MSYAGSTVDARTLYRFFGYPRGTQVRTARDLCGSGDRARGAIYAARNRTASLGKAIAEASRTRRSPRLQRWMRSHMTAGGCVTTQNHDTACLLRDVAAEPRHVSMPRDNAAVPGNVSTLRYNVSPQDSATVRPPLGRLTQLVHHPESPCLLSLTLTRGALGRASCGVACFHGRRNVFK